jgi:hypothetical protein
MRYRGYFYAHSYVSSLVCFGLVTGFISEVQSRRDILCDSSEVTEVRRFSTEAKRSLSGEKVMNLTQWRTQCTKFSVSTLGKFLMYKL